MDDESQTEERRCQSPGRELIVASSPTLWYTPAPRTHAATQIYMPPDRRAVLESTALKLPCEMKAADDPKLS
jgi:hypothetical protein